MERRQSVYETNTHHLYVPRSASLPRPVSLRWSLRGVVGIKIVSCGLWEEKLTGGECIGLLVRELPTPYRIDWMYKEKDVEQKAVSDPQSEADLQKDDE